ncbi:S8 family serine peptidase [Lentzea alba]|uniref:S8 family peptidase n=1 Tax=Lentzea alba TaxID=2714351 RepID=UPI0039BFFB03
MRRPVLLVVALALLGLPAVASASPPADRVITLITGDEVVLTGSRVAVRPGPGRSHVSFLQQTGVPDISVVPSDAAPLLRDGRLDPRLFNISELERQGFVGSALPVIVSGAVPGMRASRALSSLNAFASTASVEVWQAALAGSARVWLDGRARVVLDQSTRQVGAPAAWSSGITGKGVTIADLDGGWDPGHPDLTGVAEARDFTGTGIRDGYGHGTHTASTIGGTGAGSGGKYRGVAPDVRMLVGKVCTDDGGCPESAIIAGMEWAAASGAAAVNLSLGGPPTDGTDPMSLAVNALTARYGTLFVVAAGNSGAPRTVGTPGSADSALTVGSVTKQDALSSFSSRGPRFGDYALKPDIAAPGSSIVAARASGTSMGTPVDALYTSASGTSMATPHVTGAAALLKQAHPSWRAAELKAALMASSFELGLSVYEQGAGRLDIARALGQSVTSSPASLSFPFVTWPRTGPITRTVTYSNASASPVSLSLKPPAGPFSLSVSSLLVPAGGTASVDVTLTPGVQGGQFGGALVASGAGVVVRTPLGAVVEEEKYTLSLDVVGRDGADPWYATVQVIDVATGKSHGYFFTDGARGSVRVPKGRYDVHAMVNGYKRDTTLLSSPEVVVGGDTSVRFDARSASALLPKVDRPGAKAGMFYLSLFSGNATKSTGIGLISSVGGDTFAAPTPRVSGRVFQFWYQPVLVAGDAVYNLMFVRDGGIPDPASLVVRDSSLARVHATYQSQGGAPAVGVRGGYGYYKGLAPSVTVLLDMPVPTTRTEFYTPGPDVEWDSTFGFRGGGWGEYQRSPRRSYSARSYTVVWNRSPLGPSLGSYEDNWGLSRTGDVVNASIPLFSTAGDWAYTESWGSYANASTTLSLDGKQIASSPYPGWISASVQGAGKYTLSTVTDRPAPYSAFGTHASASWTFNSPGTTSSRTALPLMVVRASGKTDRDGLAPSGRAFVLDLKVEKQKGAKCGRVGVPRVEVSYDDGKTWERALVVGKHALLFHPRGKAFVSLRMSVSDSLGNSASHTVIRAYEVVPR